VGGGRGVRRIRQTWEQPACISMMFASLLLVASSFSTFALSASPSVHHFEEGKKKPVVSCAESSQQDETDEALEQLAELRHPVAAMC